MSNNQSKNKKLLIISIIISLLTILGIFIFLSKKPNKDNSLKSSIKFNYIQKVDKGIGKDKNDNTPICKGSLIEMLVNRNMDIVKTCYQNELSSNPILQGDITISWKISSIGRVSKIRVIKDTLHNNKVINCMKNRIQNLLFSRGRSKNVCKVIYPFVFNHKS